MSYLKPMMRTLEADAATCGCNFRFNETPSECSTAVLPGVIDTGGVRGPCVTVDGKPGPGSGEFNLNAIQQNTILAVGDGSIAVTPFANTGLPASQPVSFGIPIGTRGIYLYADGAGNVAAATGSQVGVSAAGQTILLP